MKKSIFDLNYKEYVKIEKELMKSSYYKRYLLINLVDIVAILIFAIGIGSNSKIDSNILIILFCFISLIIWKFVMRRMDLAKKYYDEKYLNKKDE